MTSTATTTAQPVLVLGATGKTGRRVATGLRERGHTVREATRRGRTRFDWYDENTWEPALEGVRAAYLVDSQRADAATPLRAFGKLAAERGVRRLVFLSARDWVVPAGEEKLPGERAVRESGAEWTILKPAWFAQNFSEDPFYLSQLLDGELAWSTGEGVEPYVDARDIAEVAIAALTEDGHAGQAYELTGPRTLGTGEVAALIARATGRDIRYRPLTPEEFRRHATGRGLDAEHTDLLNELFGWIAESRFATLADGVQRALGRAPRDFTDYAHETAGTGVWHP